MAARGPRPPARRSRRSARSAAARRRRSPMLSRLDELAQVAPRGFAADRRAERLFDRHEAALRIWRARTGSIARNAISHCEAPLASQTAPADGYETSVTGRSVRRPSSRASSTETACASPVAGSRCARTGLPKLMSARIDPVGASSWRCIRGWRDMSPEFKTVATVWRSKRRDASHIQRRARRASRGQVAPFCNARTRPRGRCPTSAGAGREGLGASRVRGRRIASPGTTP